MRRIFILVVLFWLATYYSSAQTLPFAEGEVDIHTPYVGQPIIYTLRIFTTEAIDDSTIIEPSFFGFGRSRITLEPSTYTETRDSIGYSVIEQSYVIYPLRDGDLTIDPFRIEIPETPFSDAQAIFTDSIEIDVQPYPEPAPASFVNAVGQFDIVAQANPTTLDSGDTLNFSITISGTGNFEQMLAPIINLPENWRLFDGTTLYQQDNLRFGTKTFSWTVIVQGSIVNNIPAIEFSFFNPQTGQYETRSTAPIALTLVPVTAPPEMTVERTQIVLTDVPIPDLLPIRVASPLAPEPPFWFWSLWSLPPLVTFLIWLFARPKKARREQTVTLQRPRKKSGNRALRELRNNLLNAQLVEPKTAYEQIADAIYVYLSTKTGEVVSHNNAREAMTGFPANYRDNLLNCLDEANAGQYAPVTVADVRNLSQRVLRVCMAIEKAS